jgi:hypothetical protein
MQDSFSSNEQFLKYGYYQFSDHLRFNVQGNESCYDLSFLSPAEEEIKISNIEVREKWKKEHRIKSTLVPKKNNFTPDCVRGEIIHSRIKLLRSIRMR